MTRVLSRPGPAPADDPLRIIAFTGVDGDDFAGQSVADAGDVNGGGVPDLIIGAFGADRGAFGNAGEAYIVFGEELRELATAGGVAELSLSELGDGLGVTLLGEADATTFSNGAWSVSGAGDVDGDQLDDVLFGSWAFNILTGRAYVVYGSTLQREAGGLIDLADLGKADGVVLDGESIVDWTGYQVSDIGDLDGDGLDEILVGAGQADGLRGRSYIVFGSALAEASGEGGDGTIALGDLSGGRGVTIIGAQPNDIMGFQLSGAGDVDGDDVPDLVAGGWTGGPAREGRATVVFGDAILAARAGDGVIDLSAPPDGAAITLDGISPDDAFGRSVSEVGDIDGDGFDEVMIGAYLTPVDGETFVGEVHLISGAALAAETSGAFDVSDLSGGRGVTLRGDEERDLTGYGLADAGDVDGDGVPDLLIGAYGLNPISGAYVVFGSALVAELGPDGDGVLNLDALTPEQGVIIRGVAEADVAGWSVSSAGDIDGDGRDDVLMGAWEGDLAGPSDAGEAYLITSTAIAEAAAADGILDLSAILPLGAVAPSPTAVGAGNHFSLFLREGELLAAGENVVGQLAQGVAGFDIAAPVAVTLPEDFDAEIASVSAGLVHGAFLTEDGDVYTWGLGNFGRLGLGDEEDRTTAEKIGGDLDDREVVVIDMGNGASFAITEDGSLWAWGQNSNGQLGLGDREERLRPTRVEALDGEIVVAVSSGTSHSLALTADGEVWAFGRASRGQLGSPDALDAEGDPVSRVPDPVKVAGLPDGIGIVAVTADTNTSYAVLEDGRVFGWGEGSFGQLMQGVDNGDGTFEPDSANVLEPVELPGLPATIVDVKGGARWAAALTSDGDVWLWGPNDRGPSGGLDGDAALETDASFFPVRMTAFDAPFVVEIQTGPNSLIAVTDTGEILTLGSNSDGRLGYATDGPTTEPQAVDFEADTAPFLLAATPGDNGRDVQVDANLELVFTEAVTAGGGAVRVVNRDDPEDAVEVSAAAASIDGAAVTIDLPGRLTPGARYDVRIDDDAFFDLAGQPYGGLDAGDVGDFDFRVMQAVEGSDGADRLSGGDRAEVIAGGAGRSDLLAGGGGADIFRFGDETSNGVREMDQIRDYDAEQGDRIDLGGAEIASIRETSRFVTLTLEGDGDAVMIRGVASFEDLVFV